MIIEHRLIDSDTLESLAYQYLGDASRAKELAEFNNLDYPYIVKSKAEVEKYYATGYLKITRKFTDLLERIRTGWTFQTSVSPVSFVHKEYIVTQDVVFAPGVDTVHVPVRSLIIGSFGNVGAGEITSATEATLQATSIHFDTITNPISFTNGKDVRIKFTGDLIYIPAEDTQTEVTQDIEKMLEYTGGEDIVLDFTEDIADNRGDIASVKGLENIKQAIKNRLSTEKGTLIYHPEYGVDIVASVGMPSVYNLEKRIELEILQALSYEDRITDVSIIDVRLDKTAMYINIAYKVRATGISEEISLPISRGVL